MFSTLPECFYHVCVCLCVCACWGVLIVFMFHLVPVYVLPLIIMLFVQHVLITPPCFYLLSVNLGHVVYTLLVMKGAVRRYNWLCTLAHCI